MTNYDSSGTTSTAGNWYVISGWTTTSSTAYWGDTTSSTATGTWYISSTPYIYTSISQPEKTTKKQRAEAERSRRLEQERMEREAEELRKEQEAAVKAAEELLKEFVGLEKVGKLHEVGYIEVDSQKNKGMKYRVPKDHMRRILVLNDKDECVDELCVHPAINCPAGDHILTRLVMLESDEDAILKASNHAPRLIPVRVN